MLLLFDGLGFDVELLQSYLLATGSCNSFF